MLLKIERKYRLLELASFMSNDMLYSSKVFSRWPAVISLELDNLYGRALVKRWRSISPDV